MYNEIETEQMCCCCRINNEDLLSMLEPHIFGGEMETFTSMIMECFQIEIENSVTDVHKNLFMMCQLCASQLRGAFQFRLQVQNAYNRARDMVNHYEVKMESLEQTINPSIDNIEFVNVNTNIVSFDNEEIKLENGYSDDNYVCKICAKVFPGDEELDNHIKFHFPIFICHICDEDFANEQCLDEHVRCHGDNAHSIMQSVQNEEIVYDDDEKREDIDEIEHKKKTANTSQKKDKKKKTARTKSSKNPIIIQISSEKDADETNQGQYHLAGSVCIKNGSKQFCCKYCTKEFKKKNDLSRHILTHLGVKNFHCTICEKSFPRKFNLLRHMKLHFTT